MLLDLKGEEGLAEMGEVNDIGLSTFGKLNMWMANNRKWMIVVSVFIFIGILYVLWSSVWTIGIYEGYAPEQPIKFSHKIHAGDDGIDCVY